MVDDRLEKLVRLQHGVVRRNQLAMLDVAPGFVRAQVHSRRWRRLSRTVIALHNGPLTQEQRRWAAVLQAADRVVGAALCGLTAAEAAGLTGWSSESIHVLVPRGAKLPDLAGIEVTVHESRRFSPADIHPVRTPPQTRVERSVIDAAAWSPDARSACGILAAAAQQRLSNADRLAAELGAAGQVRYCQLLANVINDIGGGAEALSEINLGNLCRRFALPEPIGQAVRLDPAGRRRYLDAELRRGSRRIAIEIDGALHLLVTSYWRDMDRHNELVIAGERLLRFPSVALYLDPAHVADQIRRALDG